MTEFKKNCAESPGCFLWILEMDFVQKKTSCTSLLIFHGFVCNVFKKILIYVCIRFTSVSVVKGGIINTNIDLSLHYFLPYCAYDHTWWFFLIICLFIQRCQVIMRTHGSNLIDKSSSSEAWTAYAAYLLDRGKARCTAGYGHVAIQTNVTVQ